MLLRSEARIKDTLRKLRETGVRIALDDFGTAFASLSYLRNFSFDSIKIDRSFVAEMADRQDCMAIVTAVAGLAKALDIGSVAEGIETVEQLAQVTSAGCNEVQGYYFSPPVLFREHRARARPVRSQAGQAAVGGDARLSRGGAWECRRQPCAPFASPIV